MSSPVHRFVRSRLAWPVAIALGLLVVYVSESFYRIESTDAGEAMKIDAARFAIRSLRQAASELELSYRGLVLSGDAQLRGSYRAAREAVTTGLRSLNTYYGEEGSARPRDRYERLAAAYAAHVAEMDRVVALRDGGDIAQARASIDDAAMRHRVDEQIAARLLQLEEGVLDEDRDSFLAGLQRERIGVIVLVMAALATMAAFRRSEQRALRLREEQREQQRLALEDERRRLEQAVALRTRQLRALTQHLQTAVEDERATLARDLHDELGALLTAAKFDLARLKSRLPAAPEWQDLIAQLNAMLNEGLAIKQRIVEDLRPSALSNLGLVPALEILCQQSQERLGIPVLSRFEPLTLGDEGALTVYRFVQEALTNIARHARASQVWVSLLTDADGTVRVEVRDDGVGFDVNALGMTPHGLSGMQFRVESMGGTMLLHSAPGGTVVAARLPHTSPPSPAPGAPPSPAPVTLQRGAKELRDEILRP